MTDGTPQVSVEFLGLPGAGKSTVEGLLVRELKRSMTVYDENALTRKALLRHIRQRERGRLKVGAFIAGRLLLRNVYAVTKYEVGAFNRFNLEHSALTSLIMEAASNDSVPLSRKEKICKLWFKFTSAWQLAKESGPPRDMTIWSEGFAQRGLSAIGMCPPERAFRLLDDYARMLPAPSCVIHVTAPIETLTDRMTKRSRGVPEPLRSMSNAERSAYLSQLETYVELLFSQLDPGTQRVTLDNHDGAVSGILGLAREVRERLHIQGQAES
ncbi:hypothetical protein [Aquisalimonas asiatica]|uniref:Thymidylate kinase n=1 Tax=Aquisalimonas asiatica TaxID=406100 RepID=A0A1H8VHP2_9GAMM|nr:hypothetical protein [Aquisalimonas asiatica]SEP14727.1 hypothetical protein SAMN04488052_11272 [Aquisalimonas asiatica]